MVGSGAEVPGPRILIVDDDAELLRAYTRLLTKAGFRIDPAADGAAATVLLAKTRYDAVVSDIAMPGMDGIQLLRKVRERDTDVPVILVTATPSLETAIRAVEYGALRYLVKPVGPTVLEEAVRRAVRLHELARVKREVVERVATPEMRLSDRPSLELGFENALATLWMAYQPITSPAGAIFGYEALLRCHEPTLPSPGAIIAAAERLGQLNELGRAIRANVASLLDRRPDLTAFVNLHTKDLADEELYGLTSPLLAHAPRVVLEITERAALDQIRDVPSKVERLRKKGFRIAIDDLGAGYAGLTSFAQLIPEIVKLDISLVHGIDGDPIRQKLVLAMTRLCHDMDLIVVAEGIETQGERDLLVELGCDLMQGFLLGRPEPLD